MRICLAYGRSGLDVDVPDSSVVIGPEGRPGVDDAVRAVRNAVRLPIAGPPLRKLVAPGQRVAIAICDGTRPQPRKIVLPVLLEELSGTIDLADVVVVVATGTHRANTPAELEVMLGGEVLRCVRVENHDARDDASLAFFGTCGDGVPVYLNREWLEADVRITTGFIEPHLFAGFSGRIGGPKATWAVTEGNPVHDDVRAIAAATGVDFTCDVVLNTNQEIAAVFAGELFAAHAAGCEFARSVAMRPVKQRFDVVVTTNAGFPLDQNLYQSVKGQSAAMSVVRPGGLIVVACECSDGFPDHGSYRELITSYDSPRRLSEAIMTAERARADQWVLQIQARIQETARVGVHAGGLSAAELRSAHFEPVDDVSAYVEDELARVGPGATCCVLPQGPLTVPHLA